MPYPCVTLYNEQLDYPQQYIQSVHNMSGGPNITDQILRTYIETVFDKYDTDKSGGLDSKELSLFFKDLFTALKMPANITEEHAREAIKSIDQNSDGTIDKKELFDAFKMLMGRGTQQGYQQGYQYQGFNNGYQAPYGGYGGYGAYGHNPYMQPPPPSPMQQPYGMYPPPPRHSWQADPMMSNIQNPYANNAHYQQPPPPPPPNPNINMTGSTFGGGWSKRYKP